MGRVLRDRGQSAALYRLALTPSFRRPAENPNQRLGTGHSQRRMSGQQRAAMLVRVRAVTPHVRHLVARPGALSLSALLLA